MDPYEVLDVPSNASDAEIKAAYRRAVKKHHPDVAGDSGNDTIVLINQAYELLTDPLRKRSYDLGSTWVYEPVYAPEPDAREIYRQQFIEKKKAQAKARLDFEKKVFDKLFYVNILIAAFALMLIVDQQLPTIARMEFALDIPGDIRTDQITTETYVLDIPRSAELDHTFVITKPVFLECSPIFRVPTRAFVEYKDRAWTFEPAATVFSFAIPFHYIILLFCAISLCMRTFSPVAFSICFAPSIMLFFMVTIVM
jgi:hypothetical protein